MNLSGKKRARTVGFSERNFPITGFLEITIFGDNGQLVEKIDAGQVRIIHRPRVHPYSGDNLVVNVARISMARLVVGVGIAENIITQMNIGDGGHVPATPTQALTPSILDTELYGTELIKKATVYDFPDGDAGMKVRVSMTLEADEANGSGAQALSEAGLLMADDDMFAHKCFGIITKTAGISIRFRWTLAF